MHSESSVCSASNPRTKTPPGRPSARWRPPTGSLQVPLTVHGESLGALNLYAETAGAFTKAHEETVQVFADQAAIALANAQVYWDARHLSENLTQAIKSRETIDHAVGILMATGGRSPQDAFQLLVRASQRENRKLRDVAEEIVTRTIERKREG
jgi:GAF domain-containing protein